MAEEARQLSIRKAGWGSVVEVASGIGVELVGEGQEPFLGFVRAALEVILTASRTGAGLVAQFDPKVRASKVETGPYARLTIFIGTARRAYKSGPKMVYPEFRTQDVGLLVSAAKRDFGEPKLPRIQLLDPSSGDEQQVGNDPEVKFAAAGLSGHKDFPGAVVSPALVLYHELMHAYLSIAGVAGRLRSEQMAQKTFSLEDNFEERLVVGLDAGKGLELCENAYRCETGSPVRRSYKAVGINEDTGLSCDDWKQTITLLEALKRLPKFTEDEAKYVAGT